MEIELNDAKLRVYECGKIEKFGKKSWNSKEKWHELKGYININKKDDYRQHQTNINKKLYTTSRIIYYAFNPDWDIHNSQFNNSIDHVDRNSLNNNLSNLRVATASEQNINRDCVINAKGCSFNKNRNKWQAYISINCKQLHLGCFDTEQEAHQAYQTYKLKNNILL